MPIVSPRRAAASIILATSALAVSACVPPPPSGSAQPIPTPLSPAPAPTTTPTPAGTTGAAEELPSSLPIGTTLAPGTLAGWETDLVAATGFETQSDSTFPAGPLLHVVETSTGCDIWAYQGTQDGSGTDERAQTEATLATLTGTQPGDWVADVVTVGPSASQGVTVEFLSIVAADEGAPLDAVYARNYQSSGTTTSLRIQCPAGSGDLDHADALVEEHFSINFLKP